MDDGVGANGHEEGMVGMQSPSWNTPALIQNFGWKVLYKFDTPLHNLHISLCAPVWGGLSTAAGLWFPGQQTGSSSGAISSWG